MGMFQDKRLRNFGFGLWQGFLVGLGVFLFFVVWLFLLLFIGDVVFDNGDVSGMILYYLVAIVPPVLGMVYAVFKSVKFVSEKKYFMFFGFLSCIPVYIVSVYFFLKYVIYASIGL